MSTRRKGAGLANSPLAAVLTPTKQSERPQGRREPVTTFSISVEVGERVRNAAHHLRMSCKEFVEEAVMNRVREREKEHGGVFPPRRHRG